MSCLMSHDWVKIVDFYFLAYFWTSDNFLHQSLKLMKFKSLGTKIRFFGLDGLRDVEYIKKFYKIMKIYHE